MAKAGGVGQVEGADLGAGVPVATRHGDSEEIPRESAKGLAILEYDADPGDAHLLGGRGLWQHVEPG
jgi:hypothetical protein